jgi:hypothetical protein
MSGESTVGRPAVQVQPPSEAFLKVFNAILRRVLASRAHRIFSKELMLLHVTGRRSGRSYTVPVSRHTYQGQLVLSAGGRWKRNFVGGADCELTIDGQRRRARAELVSDPHEVAVVFADLLRQEGLGGARKLALKVNVDRMPTVEELQDALRAGDRQVVRVRLVDA